MKGLGYIRQNTKLTLEDVATQLGVSKQFVSDWETGRKNIPAKHLPKLQEIFGVPEQYYQKELSEIDKLRIENYHFERAIEDSSFVDEDGYGCVDQDAVILKQYNDAWINKMKLQKKINSIITKDDDGEADLLSLGKVIDSIDKYTRLFDKFADIVTTDVEFTPILRKVITAMQKVLNGDEYDENNFIGKLAILISAEYEEWKGDWTV